MTTPSAPVLRVLFAYGFLGLGGVETVLVTRADALRRHRVESSLLFGRFYGDGGREFASRPDVHVGLSDTETRSLLEDSRFDAIVVADYPEFLDTALGTGATVIFETHAGDLDAARRYHEAAGTPGVRAVFAPTRFNADAVRRVVPSVGRVAVLPFPVDVETFTSQDPARAVEVLGVPIDLPLVLWVGRIEREKNPLELLAIAERMSTSRHDLRYVVVGASPDDPHAAAQLRDAVPDSLRPRFTFFDSIGYQDMPLLYSLAFHSGGCLLSTSLAESCPMTFLEAMSCGSPVLSTRIGGVTELIEPGWNGWLYLPGDLDGAVTALEEIIDLKAADRRAEITSNAKVRVLERHASDRAAALYADALWLVVGRVPHARRPALPPTATEGSESNPFRVLAIIAAFNEEEIISQVIAHLVANDVDVYLIDDGSTDATVEEARAWLGRGLVGLDAFEPVTPGVFDWSALLHRKLEIAAAHPADWYIHHDADEIRHGPWPSTNLKESIRYVDACGYNCIDSRVLNFRPVEDGFRRGIDPRSFFSYYEEAAEYDRLQVKSWKATADPVDLAASGGHDVTFPGRRVFPIKFLVRHYPIRSQEHGRRKVFQERKPRFAESERAIGWHLQYDLLDDAASFLAEPSKLERFDLDRIRLELMLHSAPYDELRDDRARTATRVQELLERLRRADDLLAPEACD